MSANAAPKAIDASAPSAPSYWLAMTTGIRSARHSPSTSRDSENPVRATFTLTCPTAPSSIARRTSVSDRQLSSPASGTSQRSASSARPRRSSIAIGSSMATTPSPISASPASIACSRVHPRLASA